MIPAKVPASRPEQAREAEQVPAEIVASGASLASKESIQNTSIETNKDVQRVVTYPVWPTSQPGPQATPPPAEQHPHPRRSEQMIYTNYDQERGMVGVPLPKLAEQEHRGKKYTLEATLDAIPAASVQDSVTETK
jgi:hypothetical protein